MNIITAQQISKAYADQILLNEVSFHIGENDKIAVIGVNGTGKSTLLKMIAGLEKPDQGQFMRARQLTIEYLPQLPEFPRQATVFEAVLHGHSPVLKLIREYEQTTRQLNQQNITDKPKLNEKLIHLSHEMDRVNAWQLDSDIKAVLTQLGITQFDQFVSTLSGGQKKRVALAAALVNPADLLILDEPTNHIDAESIAWLESWLANYKGALLMVTHDRYFLERVTRTIFELDNHQLYSCDANYSQWLTMKQDRLEQEQASEKKRQNLYRQELAWMRQGAKARSTKQQARINRFETLKNLVPAGQEKAVSMETAASRLGKKTLILDAVGKSFPGASRLIRNFSYIIDHRERLGIVGPNGCGKTTLLNLIAGTLEPDSGSRDIGSTVKIGFFTQEVPDSLPNQTVINYIRETAEMVVTQAGSLSASQMLERFLFPPEVQWKPVAKLSGGEKRRLYLLRILMQAPNILLLDEPTNDLDIMTLSVLENYLEEFPGAVISVSHDRYFLDKTAERILAFESNGDILQFEGNFQAYLEQRQGKLRTSSVLNQQDKTDTHQNSLKQDRQSSDKPLRLSYHEQREIITIDEAVASLEAKLAEIEAGQERFASDYQKLQELNEAHEQVTRQIEEAMGRWLFLNEKIEAIENEKQGLE